MAERFRTVVDPARTAGRVAYPRPAAARAALARTLPPDSRRPWDMTEPDLARTATWPGAPHDRRRTP